MRDAVPPDRVPPSGHSVDGVEAGQGAAPHTGGGKPPQVGPEPAGEDRDDIEDPRVRPMEGPDDPDVVLVGGDEAPDDDDSSIGSESLPDVAVVVAAPTVGVDAIYGEVYEAVVDGGAGDVGGGGVYEDPVSGAAPVHEGDEVPSDAGVDPGGGEGDVAAIPDGVADVVRLSKGAAGMEEDGLDGEEAAGDPPRESYNEESREPGAESRAEGCVEV